MEHLAWRGGPSWCAPTATAARAVFAAALLFVAGRVDATSCAALRQHYLVECRGGTCVDALLAGEVASSPRCGRRPEVTRVAPAAGALLARIVEAGGSPADGVHAIAFSRRWWEADRLDGSLDGVFDHLIATRLPRSQREPARMQAMTPAQLRAALQPPGAGSGCACCAPGSPASNGVAFRVLADAADLATLHARLRQAAHRERMTQRFGRGAWWFSMLATLALLLQSCARYLRRVRPRDAHRGSLLPPLATQLAVLTLAVAVEAWHLRIAWSGGPFIPLVLLVLVIEATAWMRWRCVPWLTSARRAARRSRAGARTRRTRPSPAP